MTLLERLGIDEDEIERYLEELFCEDLDLLKNSLLFDAVIKLVRSGGKRIRPALLIIASRFGDKAEENKKEAYRAAAVVEAVHLSSLIHDDIIDKSDMRRNMRTLNAELGNRRAVFAGNYIFSRATELLAENTESDSHIKVNKSMKMMCRGELKQIEQRFDFNLSLKGYFARAEAKTARLMSACLYSGAFIGGAGNETLRLLEKTGHDLGIAFQIVDDMLDFTQDNAALGKPAGSDLISGIITLPTILAMDDIIREMPDFIRDVNKNTLNKAVCIIKESEAIEKCRVICNKFITRANKQVGRIAGRANAKRSLLMLMDFIRTRQF